MHLTPTDDSSRVLRRERASPGVRPRCQGESILEPSLKEGLINQFGGGELLA